MARIATWNVNSLRVRLPHLLDWLARTAPDIVALQEIKLTDEQCPVAELNAAGYRVLVSGQKSYNGVALLAREEGREVVTDLPGLDDPQRRVLGATFGPLRVLNLYVPNGQEVGSDKFAYKLAWLEHLRDYLRVQLAEHRLLVVLGDFNIAHEARDVHDPAAWEGRVLFSAPERMAFAGLLDLGLVDTFRLFAQPDRSFSWWDYRLHAFKRNLGLRIDHILASRELAPLVRNCAVDKAPRALERPSDHAPVVVDIELSLTT